MNFVFTERNLKFTILEIFQTYTKGRANKYNILGKPSQAGDIERKLELELSSEERALAGRALNELIDSELLISDYADIISPNDWLTITEQGKRALQRRVLDDLDHSLLEISKKLIELRDGMWSAYASKRTNYLQQAAHSARELIDQTLREGSISELKTRKERIKYLLKEKAKIDSKSEESLIDSISELLIDLNNRIIAAAHTREDLIEQNIKELLVLTEIALRRMLIPRNGKN